MLCSNCGGETEQLININNNFSACISCCKEYLNSLEYSPKGHTIMANEIPVFYYNKENNVKACWVGNLPEDAKTIVFMGKEEFAIYNKALSEEELDNLKELPTLYDWSSKIEIKK